MADESIISVDNSITHSVEADITRKTIIYVNETQEDNNSCVRVIRRQPVDGTGHYPRTHHDELVAQLKKNYVIVSLEAWAPRSTEAKIYIGYAPEEMIGNEPNERQVLLELTGGKMVAGKQVIKFPRAAVGKKIGLGFVDGFVVVRCLETVGELELDFSAPSEKTIDEMREDLRRPIASMAENSLQIPPYYRRNAPYYTGNKSLRMFVAFHHVKSATLKITPASFEDSSDTVLQQAVDYLFPTEEELLARIPMVLSKISDSFDSLDYRSLCIAHLENRVGCSVEQYRRQHLARMYNLVVGEYVKEMHEHLREKSFHKDLKSVIKINLPANYESFQSGNGEGIWVSVTQEVDKAIQTGKEDGVYVGFLQNQPIYPKWLHLTLFDPVIFEARKEKRAVAFLDQGEETTLGRARLYPALTNKRRKIDSNGDSNGKEK